MKQISNLFVASLALFLLIAEPALAQSIDLSPIQSLLQGIVDALTGPLGVVIATFAVLGVFLSWFFNIIDLRQALWVLVGIAGVDTTIELTLARRDQMGFRMLLGRQAIRGRFLVDPGRSYLGGRPPRAIRQRNRSTA